MFTIILYILCNVLFLCVATIILLTILLITYVKLLLEPVKGVCKSKARLDGKVALVTGGNAGIGLETARDLARRGARVVIASRDVEKSAAAVADIIRTTGNEKVDFKSLDLAKFSSIREFAADFNRSYDRLDLLVNNAGCAVRNPKSTEDGFGFVMQVNYFGPFLLTNLLLDKIIASKPARIVIVGSWLHLIGRINMDQLKGLNDQGYIGFVNSYGTSKLCLLLWMKALSKRLPSGVTVNALHPGVVYTDIFMGLPSLLSKFAYFIISMIFKTPEEGAQTTLHVCVDEKLAGVNGKYFMECKEANYSKCVDDEELVEKVWDISVGLTSNQ